MYTPKSIESWGLKNIFTFAKVFAMKSLWRGVFSKSIWNQVISAQYLRRGSILDWIRRQNRIPKGSSNVWDNLLKACNVLCDWLVWIPRDGRLIKVGEDPIIGSDRFYKISENLLECLHQQGIYVLAQVNLESENGLALPK